MTTTSRAVCLNRISIKESPNPVDRHVGLRLRARRMELGISQEALASELDLTFQQVQKYEKGMNRIGAGRLYRLAEMLGIEVGYFYEGLRTGNAGEPATFQSPVTEFMATPDGLMIAHAFVRIPDPKVRRAVAAAISDLSKALTPAPRAVMAAE